jgi:hypothetical protein
MPTTARKAGSVEGISLDSGYVGHAVAHAANYGSVSV